jgi:hypothetical protein
MAAPVPGCGGAGRQDKPTEARAGEQGGGRPEARLGGGGTEVAFTQPLSTQAEGQQAELY